MEEKGYVKFKGTETQGAMHTIMFQGKKVSLTLGDSRKVGIIKETGKLLIAPDLRSWDFEEIEFKINEDKAYVKELFDYMLETNHTHFPEYDERLVVLEYSK